MSILSIDLGGTKLASAVFTEEGKILRKDITALANRSGRDVGKLITDQIAELINSAGQQGNNIKSVGISVPGIRHTDSGTVWAPNISGWEKYPLMDD